MRAIGPGTALEIVASQQHGVLERIGLTREYTAAAAWTVGGDVDVVVGGARAVALAIAVGRDARWPTAPWRVPGFDRLADWAYRLVARHRYRLPGQAPWCATHPGQCDPSDG